MIYIFDINEVVIAVIEAEEGINFYALFEEHKKEWYKDLDWKKEKYEALCKEQGYTEARTYLQEWRNAYDLKIKTIGSPLTSFLNFIKNKTTYKLHHWSYVYLEEKQ